MATNHNKNLLSPDIDKLITINGLVIRTSSLVPEMREAFFECHVCHKTTSVEIERGRIAEPILCQNCNTNHSFQLIHNRSHFSDKQMVKLQESPGKWLACSLSDFVIGMRFITLVIVICNILIFFSFFAVSFTLFCNVVTAFVCFYHTNYH